MIPFNVPPCVGDELDYVKQAIDSHKICGDGAFTKQCNAWLEERFHAQKVLLTTSGTTALDMAMLLCDIHPGDEVILPSFTFSSTATAAVLAGAKLVFVDIRPDTMNIDETKIEQAITDRRGSSSPCTTPVSPVRWTPSWTLPAAMTSRSLRTRRRAL